MDNTAYEISEVGEFDIQLRDPALRYPIFRSESRERFEELLWKDSRNSSITEFLAANLSKVNEDFREALTAHLLTNWDKESISGWFHSGEGNAKIGQRLSEQFSGRAETIELSTGDAADYFTSTTGMEVILHDKFSSRVYMGWALVPALLRGLYRQNLDGFSHEPVHQKTEPKEEEPKQPRFSTETVAVYPSEETNLPYTIQIEKLHIEEPKREQEPEDQALQKAKELINRYCLGLFDQEANFSDLHHVDLAMSSTKDYEHLIEISADLIEFRLVYQVDQETVVSLQCHDLEAVPIG